MKCSVYHEDSYGDRIFEAFELTINGDTRYYTSPIQRKLLELDDGTILDVEIIGNELTVDTNTEWMRTTESDYEWFPSSDSYDPDTPHLYQTLTERGVTFRQP